MIKYYLFFLNLCGITPLLAMTLPEHMLHTYDCDDCGSLSHEALEMSWPSANQLSENNPLIEQKSLKYQEKVTLEQLKKGLVIHTEAPGAVVRISLFNDNPQSLKPNFYLQKKQMIMSIKDASSALADENNLQDDDFNNNTLTIFKFKKALGAGEFTIKEDSANVSNSEHFMVNVFDSQSKLSLNMATNKSHYQLDDLLTVTIALSDTKNNYPIHLLKAWLTGPNNETITLPIQKTSDNTYQAQIKLDSVKNPHGQNWYIHTKATADIKGAIIKREVHTAISYSIPSAAIADISNDPSNPFRFNTSIKVATDSRYALQAIFFATDEKGNKQAIRHLQSAAWLPAGDSGITLTVPEDIAKHYQAPYYLGSIELIDYGQLKPVDTYEATVDIHHLR